MAIAAGVMARLSQTPTGAAHLPAVGVLLLGMMLMVSCAGGSLEIPTDADLERATYLTESTEVGDGHARRRRVPPAGRPRLGQRTRDPARQVDNRRH